MPPVIEAEHRTCEDLVLEFRQTGAQASFDQIVRRHSAMVAQTCLRVTRNLHDAEDATQAVFLTLAVQIRTGKPILKVGAWLRRVAYRTSLDIRRSRKRRLNHETRRSVEIDSADFQADPTAPTDFAEVRKILQSELDQLPAKYRLPVILHFFGGMPHHDIAGELSITPNALSVRLHRAKQMLASRLATHGITLGTVAMGALLTAIIRGVISDRLLHSTAQMAAHVAKGGAISASGSSPWLMLVAERALMPVMLVRWKMAAAVLVASGSALAGGVRVAQELPGLREIKSLISPMPRPRIRSGRSRPTTSASSARSWR